MSTASFEVMPGTAPDVMRDYHLSTLGYEETEFAVSGTAQSYELKGERGANGEWDVVPGADASFRTRIVVRRPSDPGRFSGTVVVEWHNVSAGIDAAPDCWAGRCCWGALAGRGGAGRDCCCGCAGRGLAAGGGANGGRSAAGEITGDGPAV